MDGLAHVLDAVPTIHRTESYGNNRLRLWDVYEGKHSDVTAVIESATRKGDATDVECIRATCRASIAGDLFHEVLSVKWCCIVWANDAADWISKMASSESRRRAQNATIP